MRVVQLHAGGTWADALGQTKDSRGEPVDIGGAKVARGS